jgi:hypothetical protein
LRSVLYAFRYALAALLAVSVLNASPLFDVLLGDGLGTVSGVTAASETEELDVAGVCGSGTIASGEGEGVEDSEVI